MGVVLVQAALAEVAFYQKLATPLAQRPTSVGLLQNRIGQWPEPHEISEPRHHSVSLHEVIDLHHHGVNIASMSDCCDSVEVIHLFFGGAPGITAFRIVSVPCDVIGDRFE